MPMTGVSVRTVRPNGEVRQDRSAVGELLITFFARLVRNVLVRSTIRLEQLQLRSPGSYVATS